MSEDTTVVFSVDRLVLLAVALGRQGVQRFCRELHWRVKALASGTLRWWFSVGQRSEDSGG